MGKRISCQCPVINMSSDRQGNEYIFPQIQSATSLSYGEFFSQL
jgi:hypothetical protein